MASAQSDEKILAIVLKFQEEGPFIFNELLRVAKLCARTKDVRIPLSQVLHRFADEELVKFIQAGQENSNVCSRKMYRKLAIGIDMNEIFYLNLSRFTDRQLALIEQTANSMQFDNLVAAATFNRLTSPERGELLKLIRLSQTRQLLN